MLAEEFRQEVQLILGSELKFDGHVNKIIDNLIESKVQSILQWIRDCQAGQSRAEPCKNFRNLMAFIFKSNDNRIRGILIKEKNSYFIQLFLDKHQYYDQK